MIRPKKAERKGTHDRGLSLVVTFEDNFTVTFFPNYGGWDNPPRINEELRLRNHTGLTVAQFYSPYQYPRNCWNPDPNAASPFGFQPLDAAAASFVRLSAAQIGLYFAEALEFVRIRQAEDSSSEARNDHWRIASCSVQEINEIRTGQHPLPIS